MTEEEEEATIITQKGASLQSSLRMRNDKFLKIKYGKNQLEPHLKKKLKNFLNQFS